MLALWQLYGVAFGVGTLSVLFTVCDPALFVALVPGERYVAGQSLVYGSRAFSFVGGPSLGGVIGSLLTRRLAARVGIGWAYVIGCVLFPAPLVLVPLAGGPKALVITALFAAEFLSGAGVMILDISIGSIFAAVIPDQLRSRVSSGPGSAVRSRRSITAPGPAGSLVAGALGTLIGVRPTLWIATLGGITGFLWLLPSPLPGFRMPPENAAERLSVGEK